MAFTIDLIPHAGILAEVTSELRLGSCCLITADKGWTHHFYHDIRDRLAAVEIRAEYIDGRPIPGESRSDDVGVMLTAITQLRRAVRGNFEKTVVVLPHLDVMTTREGGWTNISREIVPLLYERPDVLLLGFCDPTLQLLDVVLKLFPKRFTVAEPFGSLALRLMNPPVAVS